uniref:Uncharacterized protein n=1 Tax=viral metagenome TaxID=1070528 RepID=A0A6C0BNA3_9ZZZZ
MNFVPDTLHPRRVLQKVRSRYDEARETAISRVSSYALTKFGKSKYARRSFNTIPTSLIAAFFKAVVNFLLLYRLATGYRWVDFFVSLAVTVFTALISPVFYVMVQEREEDLMKFSNHFADQVALYGLDYLRMWQGRTVFACGMMAMLFVTVFEVNSDYIRHWIFESLLALWVVDRVNQWRDSLFLPAPVKVEMEFMPAPHVFQLTKYDLVKIPLRYVKKVTSDAVTPQPGRAHPIRLSNYPSSSAGGDQAPVRRVLGGTLRNVIEDWEGH